MVQINPRSHKTRFQVVLPEARKVALLGSFNEWDDSAHLMKKEKDGNWKLEVELPEGMFEFRYLVDEAEWHNDKELPAIQNQFGSENSVLEVKFR